MVFGSATKIGIGALRSGTSRLGNILGPGLKTGYGIFKGGVTNVAHGTLRAGVGRVAKNVALQGGVGLGMTGLTGDTDYMWMGLGMGVLGGGASLFRKPGSKKGLMWSKRLMFGQTVGLATGDPSNAPVGALAVTGLKMAGPSMAKGAVGGAINAPGYGLNLLRAPFAPKAALGYMARQNYPMGAPVMLGLMAGAGWGAVKMGSRPDPMEGIYMGGTNQVGIAGRKMGFNHMETAGLTLALHRNNKSLDRVY